MTTTKTRLAEPANPYLMAPEVITNPNVRNRAIDIWSLGCTVLEMATSRATFNQYHQMVAAFKAGNHKALAVIPDHLSDEGKDFVRHCLQWNPIHRATASQLLEHPFVKNVLPLQKAPPLEKQTLATNAGIDHARSFHQLDSGRLATHSSISSIDGYTPRNTSSPVPPVGSPLRHPRSPRHLNEMISPPHISSPHSSSTRQIGATPYHHLNNLSPNLPKQRPNISSPSYWDPNILHWAQSKSSENNAPGKQLGTAANEQLVLADRVSQKLLNGPVTLTELQRLR